ncbi:NAD(P)/FAD-dependent oxidoreductase [Spirosoma knui]
MDNNADALDRRTFLTQASVGMAALLAGGAIVPSCASSRSISHIRGGMIGANHQAGHRLRRPAELFKLPVSDKLSTDVLIVGGGVAGLSARRWLNQQGISDTLLVEMDERTGGNATYGQNNVSAYPYGAHYLPIPDLRNQELLRFLEEIQVITGKNTEGFPVYNEYFLCHDPEERLFINGFWQEGLVPEAGVPESDKEQIRRFFQVVDEFKVAKGADGLDAFTIPLDSSSADERFRQLDQISFASYLAEEKFTSPYLHWYLNYCCRDDYGATIETTSAWAGIHYFSSRKGQAANANASSVLTWPQGNGFLADHLRSQSNSPVRQNLLIYDLRLNDKGVIVRAYDVALNKNVVIEANKVILATPQFITKHIVQNLAPERSKINGFQYAPWVVANLTVEGLPQGRGMPLCWDNVLYDTASVGYITANHQDMKDSPHKVITYYKPLSVDEPDVARRKAYSTSYEQWLTQILDELEQAHPTITSYVSQADIWVWGHGMIAPTPGFVWGAERKQAAEPIANRLFFAHSDLSGLSIFEEAFYQGIRAAKEVLSIV